MARRALGLRAREESQDPKAGLAVKTSDLGREYDFTDIDGNLPDSHAAAEHDDVPDFWKLVRGQL